MHSGEITCDVSTFNNIARATLYASLLDRVRNINLEAINVNISANHQWAGNGVAAYRLTYDSDCNRIVRVSFKSDVKQMNNLEE